ncbi:MAG: FAD-linked oxidase C-terminal domain-containing protein [Anaerolineae bacterium]
MAADTSLLRSLANIILPERIVTNPVQLFTYEGDASLDHGTPDAVVFPRSVYEVVRLMRWAAANDVPLVARGAGTGLSGGAVPTRGGVIVEFSHMAAIRELDEIGRSAVVEPGLVNLTLDAAAKAKGWYYPPDPASGRSSTLGGNLAENAGGPHCFKYGVTANYVTGLEVVMADGRLLHFGGRALDYPEYDLVGLMTGCEGTLGVMTSASVRLLRNPPAVKTMMAAFDSVETAGEAVSAIIARGLVPATMEMMDQRMMRIIEDFVHPGLPVEAGAALIIETDGYPESVTPQLDEIIEILNAHQAYHLHVAETAAERDRIWYGRKSAAGAMARLAPAFFLVDGTVPRSHLAETLAGVNRICDAADLRVSYVFHAGDGNLHPFILIPDPRDRAFIRRVMDAGREILALCCGFDGSITGEHGVGIEKREFMPLMYSRDELDVMRDIKAVFDPADRLNPGKIFPSQLPDATPRAAVTLPPLGESFAPSSAAEAAAALRVWAEAGKSVRIRGGGAEPAPLPPADAILSTEHLRGVKKYALSDLYVTVGSGTPLAELQEALARDGMWVPLASPWPAATVGGILATAFNAPQRMRYGGARDLMLAATVALADGRVIRAGRPVVKNVAGYDLPKLFVGSHGTLGLLTDVTLKLAPLPRARATLAVPVADARQGMAVGQALLRVCLVASSLLLVSRYPDDLAVELPPSLAEMGTFLVYTAEGEREDVAAELAQATAVLQSLGLTAVEMGNVSGTDIWGAFLRGATLSRMVMRVGVPPKDISAAVAALDGAAPDGALVADVANGQVYTAGAADVAAVREMARGLGGYAVLVAAADAGDGDVWGHTPEGLDLMRQLKARWNPRGALNRGAFLPALDLVPS